MRDVGRDTTDFLAREMMSLEDDVKARMEEGIEGFEVSVASPPEEVMDTITSEADALTQARLDVTTEKGLDGQGVLDDFMAAQEEFAEQRASSGYPWQ